MAADDAALLGEAEPPAADPTLGNMDQSSAGVLAQRLLPGSGRVHRQLLSSACPARPAAARRPLRALDSVDNAPTADGSTGCFPQAVAAASPVFSPTPRISAAPAPAILRYANMRLRLQPTFSLSDNVRLHMMIDAFDNLVLGSTPEVKSVNQFGQVTGRAPGVPVDSLTRTSPPPESFRNTVGDALWFDALGERSPTARSGSFRFGRMGHQWGLGMLWNAGEGTNILGTARWTRTSSPRSTAFSSSASSKASSSAYRGTSPTRATSTTRSATSRPSRATRARFDDTRQWSFLVARRLEAIRLAKSVLETRKVGDQRRRCTFIYRTQFLSTSTAPLLSNPSKTSRARSFDATRSVYMPDGWFQASVERPPPRARVRRHLRADSEHLARATSRRPPRATDSRSASGPLPSRVGVPDRREEARRLPQGRRGIRRPGRSRPLAIRGPRHAAGRQEDISTFSFHPDYRIDLILFKEILGSACAGAYYIAPAISYDIIRSDFGRVFGARLDFIYSRAMYEQQTYSSEPNLGAELDISVYYRTENGPQFTDGFFVSGQFGVLFPLNGLRYLEGQRHQRSRAPRVSGALTCG